MRRAFRITKRRHAGSAFTGEGARLAGGRWNSPGRPVVYLSSTLSLAALEVFVHLAEDAAQLDFVYFEVNIPANVSMATLSRKPFGWNAEPPTLSSMRVGDEWLQEGRHAMFEVPSIIVPTETNILLNPFHSDYTRLTFSRERPFRFDPRMWK